MRHLIMDKKWEMWNLFEKSVYYRCKWNCLWWIWLYVILHKRQQVVFTTEKILEVELKTSLVIVDRGNYVNVKTLEVTCIRCANVDIIMSDLVQLRNNLIVVIYSKHRITK